MTSITKDGSMPTKQVPDRFTPAEIAQVGLSGLLGQHVSSVAPRLLTGQREAYLSAFDPPTDTCLWRAENAGKWLEAACNHWQYTLDAQLRVLLDDYTAHLLAVQQPDGWLGNYVSEVRFHHVDWNTLRLPAGVFPGPQGEDFFFDLWNNYVTMLGLIRYHVTTGDHPALAAACKIADLCINTFGDETQDLMAINWDWGQNPASLIYGIARLYTLTGEERYVDFCRYIMRRYGRHDTVPIFLTDTRSSAYPFDAWSHILKHCEFELHLMGLCELHRATGDRAALVTCENIYDGHYAPQMATLCLHGFKAPPTGVRIPQTYYNNLETCDVPTIIRWCVELARLTGDARYFDAIEWNLYNALLSRNLADGSVVPFPGDVTSALGVAAVTSTTDIWHCCYSMLAVGLSYIPAWCYFTAPNGISVNLYEPSIFTTEIGGVKVRLEQVTQYPLDGRVAISVEPEQPLLFDLSLRIPGWCTSANVCVNGSILDGGHAKAGTLCHIHREWRKGDQLSLTLDMPARVVRRAYADTPDQFIIERGPLILALPERLNPGLNGEDFIPVVESDSTVKMEMIGIEDPQHYAPIGFRSTAQTMINEGNGLACEPVQIIWVPYANVDLSAKYRVEFPI